MAYDIINNKLSVADIQKKMQTSKRSTTSRSFNKKSLDPEYVSKIESKISKKLDAKVKLHERKGGAGEFIISFSNRVQMEDLINKLIK